MPTPTTPLIDGLHYVPGHLDSSVHDELIRTIDLLPWQSDLRRRVQHYGYTYGYKSRTVQRIGPLPDWALAVAERLMDDDLAPYVADQLIVNEYEPGQGIARHIDKSLFAETIVSLSLGSTCIMEFRHGARKEQLLLEPMSALVLSGAARTVWQHSIPARKTDVWLGRPLKRKRRVSLTFRKVI